MAYKITLDVWVSADCTWPTVSIETQAGFGPMSTKPLPPSLLETELAEDALTRVREFAQTLPRGEQPELRAA